MGSTKQGWLRRFFSRDCRADARLVHDLDPTEKILPFLIRSRHTASGYARKSYDITHTMAYIRRNNLNPERERLSLFIVLLAALVRTAALHPNLNRFVVGSRVYQRNTVQISFVLRQRMTAAGREVTVKQTFDPGETLQEVAAKINKIIHEARSDDGTGQDATMRWMLTLPRFVLALVFWMEEVLNHLGLLPSSIMNTDPLYASVFVANLGSLDLDVTPYHHLYDRGTASFFVVLGKYKEEGQTEGDQDSPKKIRAELTFTVDERVVGGYFFVQAAKSLATFLEHPELLEKTP